MITLTKVLYTGDATAEGGREGRVASSDGRLDLMVTPPSGSGDGTGTNPEQLFAAGYAACFHSAMRLVARHLKLDPEGSTVTARVSLGPAEGMLGYGLAVELEVAVPGVPDTEQARELVEAAHQVCPYSNAIRDNVDVTLTLA